MNLPTTTDTTRFNTLMDRWNRAVPLDGRSLRDWIDLYRTRQFNRLEGNERHGGICVPLGDGNPLSSAIGPSIHARGYGRHISDWESLPTDEAGRPILGTATPKKGIAWMTFRKDRQIQGEADMTGLMYVIYPEQDLYPAEAKNQVTGWRSLPIAKLLKPGDQDTALFHEGRVRLDRLEADGASIVEVSGLSVHPDAPHKAWAFHEIMRRLVHDALARYMETGQETVLLFAIVIETRKNARKRIGKYNFIDIGLPVHPGGDNVKKTVRLMPSILIVSEFFSRMVSSYRERVAHGLPTVTLEQGIRFYTHGLDQSHLAHYPMMVELLAEIG